MKPLLLPIIIFSFITSAYSQNFKKDVATAKSSYSAGKLEDSHFALQQMLEELDIAIGKEVLKLFPDKLETLSANVKDDNVTGTVGFIGATIHRTYSAAEKNADISVVSNSPLLGSLNAFITSPLLAGLGSNGNSKVIKIQGYKSRITKEVANEKNQGYKLEIPFSNALITLTVNNTTDTEIMAMGNALPLDKISKLIQ